ncbi:MAG TPA: hypothetical protein GX004_09565 [Firmicutes bacterium]|nr:hypothetical protein [Bacillota bacterium]
MTISKTREILYQIARLLGDVSAITSGSPKKMAKRAGRRTAGKVTGRAMRKLFK